jgi:hypothetical protein
MSSLQVGRSAAVLWTNGGGQTITALGNSGPISALQYERISLYVAVANAPTGTSPTLTFTLYGLDPYGATYSLVASSAISAAGDAILQVGPSMGSGTPYLFVPQLVQVSWTVGGTTPSFTGVNATLYGR